MKTTVEAVLGSLGAWVRGAIGLLLLLRAELAPADSVVVVLTPHPEEIRQEFELGFRKWHQARHGEPSRIEWRDVGGSGEAQRFVESEFASKPSGIGIDVFFGGGPEPFLALGDRKLVEPYRPPPNVLDGLGTHANGAEVLDPAFGWFGACLSSLAFWRTRGSNGW